MVENGEKKLNLLKTGEICMTEVRTKYICVMEDLKEQSRMMNMAQKRKRYY